MPDKPVEHARPSLRRVWQTRDQRSCFYLGDALELLSRIKQNTVDCIWTDPPYFLSNDGITCVAGRMVSVNKGDWDRSPGLRQAHEFNREWLSKAYSALRPGGSIWISGTAHIYPSLGMALQEAGLLLVNDVVWVKPAPPPNLSRRALTHATEILLWATKPVKGKKRHTFHYEQLRDENAGKPLTNVWTRISPPSKSEKKFGKHPTQKPLLLVARCLRASTNAGDLILDPFAGSGTTGVAAIRTKRRFVGCDLESEFAKLAIKRLREAVGEPPLDARQTIANETPSLWDSSN